ncbi:MAG: succinylglutamate desuccinylase/aspartoacylase family protein [Nannocystaceae bacterium]
MAAPEPASPKTAETETERVSPPPFEIAGHAIAAGAQATIEIPVSILSDHTPMSLTVHVAHGREAGPAVFVSAAIHGDEILGVEIIRRLIRTPEMRHIAGTVVFVPIVNIFGFLNHTRYLPDRRDLNRSFPGATTGSLASRLARLFMDEVVARCEIGVDIHSAAIHRENLPQIRIGPDSPRAAELARAFAAPVIIHSRLREGSLRTAARELGKDVLVYESGEALRFDETGIRLGTKGVLRVLTALGMLPPDRRLTPVLSPVHSRRSSWLRAPIGGVLRSRRAVGHRVEIGELVATLSDPLGGKQTLVTATAAGLIIGRTLLPIVNEGDALFHVAEIEDPPAADASMEALSAALSGDPLFDEEKVL